MSCERDSGEKKEWNEAEIIAALSDAYGLKDKLRPDELGVLSANFRVVTFTSRREFGKSRRSSRTVVLVGERGNGSGFTEYRSGEFNVELDDMARGVQDEMPSEQDPYEKLIEWIEREVRRAQGF